MTEKDLKNNPRILICTVNAWNSIIGDNTFPTLLKDYDKDKIANLFIREEKPDSDVCDMYFRISEDRVLKSIFKRTIKTGEIVNLTDDQNNTAEFEKHLKRYNNKSRFYYPKLFLREIVWKVGKWKSSELDNFLDEFKPDVVLYEMSRYIHLNNIVMYILKRTKAKGVGCFWDDTFTYKQERGCLFKVLRFFQRRNLKRLASKTRDFFAITPKTKREADEFFKINTVLLTKPILTNRPFDPPIKKENISILYTGNLGVGRLKTVILLAKAIKDECWLRLDIYTNSYLSKKEVFELKSCNVFLHSAVPQTEVFKLQSNADVLLFAESFDDRNMIARLSFSTKITDYYSAGRCILALGNAGLASMELFKENDSAIIVNNAKQISRAIALLSDYETRIYYSKQAYMAGLNNHSISEIKKRFYSILF